MNIIIPSLDSVKITETNSASLTTTKIFIISNYIPQTLILTNTAKQEFNCILIRDEKQDKFSLGLNCYLISSKENIPAGGYTGKLTVIEDVENATQKIIDLGSFEFSSGLVDEHAPIYIKERRIGEITTPILAQDLNSQQIIFYIQKSYDGISFLDETKTVWVDYIPADFEPIYDPNTGKTLEFLSSNDVEVDDANPEPESGIDWIRLIWDVPKAAMRAPGEVKFAISVLNSFAKETQSVSYVWQTFPSSFIVYKNLGSRPELPVESQDDSDFATELDNRVKDLEKAVDALQTLDNTSDKTDYKFELGGGGADSVLNEEATT